MKLSPVLSISALHGMQMRGLAMRIPSVCLSVRLLNEWIVTKRKKNVSSFLHHTKGHLAYSFLTRRMVGGGGDSYLNWVNRPPLERNRRF